MGVSIASKRCMSGVSRRPFMLRVGGAKCRFGEGRGMSLGMGRFSIGDGTREKRQLIGGGMEWNLAQTPARPRTKPSHACVNLLTTKAHKRSTLLHMSFFFLLFLQSSTLITTCRSFSLKTARRISFRKVHTLASNPDRQPWLTEFPKTLPWPRNVFLLAGAKLACRNASCHRNLLSSLISDECHR